MTRLVLGAHATSRGLSVFAPDGATSHIVEAARSRDSPRDVEREDFGDASADDPPAPSAEREQPNKQ